MKNNLTASSPSRSGERSPFKDLTNTSTDGTATPTNNQHGQQKNASGQSWYARLSQEEKVEYLEKRRTAYQQKKAGLNRDQVAPATESPSHTATPLSNVTNTNLNDATTTPESAAINDHHQHQHNLEVPKKRSGQSWYAGLSDEKKAEHLKKLRMSRLQKKTATAGGNVNVQESSAPHNLPSPIVGSTAVSPHKGVQAKGTGNSWYGRLPEDKKAQYLMKLRMSRLQKKAAQQCSPSSISPGITQTLPTQSTSNQLLSTPCSGTTMEEQSGNDWLHKDMTYKRKSRVADQISNVSSTDGIQGQQEIIMPTSYIHGPSGYSTDAYLNKERRRKRERYSELTAEQKDVVLHRNRAYIKGIRSSLPLSDQSVILSGENGSGQISTCAPTIQVQPSGQYNPTDCKNHDENSEPFGLFEPTEAAAETDGDGQSDTAGILESDEQYATLEDNLETIQEEQTKCDDDEESRIYLGQGDVFDSWRVTSVVAPSNQNVDPYDYVYHNLPTRHHVLKPVKDCDHCGAIRFQYEGPAFCCRKGKVKIVTPEVPEELRRLFTSQVDDDAKYFRKHIRYFNSHFSFTSLGVTLDKKLKGLEKHLIIASQTSEFNKDGKWPDIEVTKWPTLECVHEPMQSDGSSCGLFLLKLMEHWTGHELAQTLTQEGIKLFRKQLPTILYESVLNVIRGAPEYHRQNNNRDTGNVVPCDNVDPKTTEVSQTSKRAKYPSPSLTVAKKPINKNELVSKLRKYIMSIDHDDSLKEIWVQSSKPYPISLCLKQLKQLLNDKHAIDTSCFNMAVRINATDELQWFNETPIHYMDLQFCDIVTDPMRDPKLRLPFDTKRYLIAKLFDCWPGMCFHVSSCNSILLPYRTCGRFILFVFNLSEKTITILDPILLSDKWKHRILDKDTLKLKDISFHLNIALQDAIPGWNDDVFLWRRTRVDKLTRNYDSNMSGFLVLKYMRSWNDKEVARPFVRNAYELQNKVLVHMLTYKDNECRANIPQVVQDLVNRIGIDYFL